MQYIVRANQKDSPQLYNSIIRAQPVTAEVGLLPKTPTYHSRALLIAIGISLSKQSSAYSYKIQPVTAYLCLSLQRSTNHSRALSFTIKIRSDRLNQATLCLCAFYIYPSLVRYLALTCLNWVSRGCVVVRCVSSCKHSRMIFWCWLRHPTTQTWEEKTCSNCLYW